MPLADDVSIPDFESATNQTIKNKNSNGSSRSMTRTVKELCRSYVCCDLYFKELIV